MKTKLRLIRAYLRLRRQTFVPVEAFHSSIGGKERHCAVGALDPVRDDFNGDPAFALLEKFARKLYGKSIFEVNDKLGIKSVMHVYRRALLA